MQSKMEQKIALTPMSAIFYKMNIEFFKERKFKRHMFIPRPLYKKRGLIVKF